MKARLAADGNVQETTSGLPWSRSHVFLRPDRPVDVLLVVLAGFAEHDQQHDRPPQQFTRKVILAATSRSRIRRSDRSLQVIWPRAAQFVSLLSEHATYLVDALEIVIAEAAEPVADLPVRARSRTGRYPLLLTAGGVTGQATCCRPIAA
jgi:hypothetical protein